MCGIFGKITMRSNGDNIEDLLKKMSAAIVHRGPDSQGHYIFVDRNDGLIGGMGCCRLAIIDLKSGDQPIANEARNIWVVYNGEIYNYPELKRSLEAKGHSFSTSTDTEVIVHLYEEYGLGFPGFINGMFAAAIWDDTKRELVLVRDRFGIKPLYYYNDGKSLVFASEIKAILRDDEIKRKINIQAVHDYLSFNYIPREESIFQGINKLPAACMLVKNRVSLKTTVYWQQDSVEYNPRIGYSQALRRTEDLLEKAVQRHLISDVPLGVFLSGGLDSSAIAFFASRVTPGRLPVFSISFDEKSYDETGKAMAVSERINADFNHIRMKPDPQEIFNTIVPLFDEPFSDSSAIPLYYLSRSARKSVKVVLSGEGGDEIFGGYMTYLAYKFGNIYGTIPAFIRERLLKGLAERMPVNDAKVSFDYKFKRFVRMFSQDYLRRHFGWKEIFTQQQKETLLSERFKDQRMFLDPFRFFLEEKEHFNERDELNNLMMADRSIFLVDDVLVKTDRVTMSCSLEARVPLLDGELADFLFSLPSSLKVHGLTTKYLLRKILIKYLPRDIVMGPKEGFNVPMGIWLKTCLRKDVEHLLSPASVNSNGIFNSDYVSSLWQQHITCRADNSRQIWGIICFMIWYRKYINNEPS